MLPCCLCVLLLTSVSLFAIIPDGTYADDGDPVTDRIDEFITNMSDGELAQEYAVSSFRTAVTDAIIMSATLIDENEGQSGGTVNIDSTVDVKSGQRYDISDGKQYVFSGSGNISVKNGGTLRFGTRYTISGDPATINLSKGSSLEMFGKTLSVESDISIVLNGSLVSSISVTGSNTVLTTESSAVGMMDLTGTLTFNGHTITGSNGNEVEMDVLISASIDPGSTVTDIRDADERIFYSGSGFLLSVSIDSLSVNIGSSICDITAEIASSSVQMSSPKGSSVVRFDAVSIQSVDIDAEFSYKNMKSIQIELSNVTTMGGYDDGRVSISGMEIVAETEQNMLFNCSIDFSTHLSLTIGDRISCAFYGGEAELWEGILSMDVGVYGGKLYLYDTNIFGELRVYSESYLSGYMNVPFRESTRVIVNEVMDASFAGDEDAYLDINIDLDYDMKIHPVEGKKLVEMTLPQYVQYELDEFFSYATPLSKIGTFHAELVDREYELRLGNDISKHYASEEIDLPEPGPREGYTFVGWCDDTKTYRGKFVMPTHDVFMTDLWSANDYEMELDSNVCRIGTEEKAIILRAETVVEAKGMMSDGSIDTLSISTSMGSVDFSKEALMGINGTLTLIITESYPFQIPEYERSVDGGMLYVVDIRDGDETLEELDGEVSLTVRYTNFADGHNSVKAYIMDSYGRLTETDYGFTMGDEGATVTVSTCTPYYCVIKSTYVEEVRTASKGIMLTAIIPIAVTGIVLALVTRKH